MEKNIITSEDEAKSLEDLLDELVQSNINESNDEIINDDETVLPNLIPIVIDKKEYFAPDVDAPYYQFRGYEIILYKQQLNHESEILRVYESESIIFNFTLTLISLYTSSDCTIKNLYAFLY